MDEDVGSSDLLAKTNPIPYIQLIASGEEQTQKFDMFDKKDKPAGHMIVTWQYFWNEPDVIPVKRDTVKFPLNKKCKLQITIVEAKFLKDEDLVGKQDPYITFQYGRILKKTTVAEDAGMHAIFNEKFLLSDI